MKEKESSRDTVMLRVYSQQVVDAFIHIMNYVLPAEQVIQSLNVTESGYAVVVVFSSKDADYSKEVIMFAEAGDDKQAQLYKATKGLVMYEDNVINIASCERIVDFVKDYCALLTNIMSFTQYVDKGIMIIPVDKPLPTRRQFIAKVRKLLNEADIAYATKYVKEQQPDIHELDNENAVDTSIIVFIESDAALIWFKSLVEYLGLILEKFVYIDLQNGKGAIRILSTSEFTHALSINNVCAVFSLSDRKDYDVSNFNDCERVILDNSKSFRQFIVDNHKQLRRLSLMCENYNNARPVGRPKTYVELLEAVDKILET